jgi:signal transduction histidine kinase/CheY-like chemotaxis protein
MLGLSTRARIMVATGLAALPLVALIMFSALDRYHADRARAETRASSRAELIATLMAEKDPSTLPSTLPSAAQLGGLLTLGSQTKATAAVVFAGGRELVRAGAQRAGPPETDPTVASALRRRAGVFIATGPDGVQRVWGLKRVAGGPLTVAYGVPGSAVWGPARAALRRDLIIAALTVMLVLLMSFLLAGRVTAPIRRLAAHVGDSVDGQFESADDLGAIERGVIRSVNERAKLEAQLRQAQKMEAVGQLAGGVAHDFNNLLTVISGYGEIARRKVGAGPGASELTEIERTAARATQLTRQLLTFARKQVIEPVVLELDDVVAELVPMLGRLIGEDIRIAMLGAEDCPPVLADRGQIEQVITNLAINARDAMPTGGILTIETGPTYLDEHTGQTTSGLRMRQYACLTVTDTGKGIDPEQLEHIFEPFYTTKDVGEGTGLGLATVHGIVTQSGGYVHAYSEPRLGATFKVFLPAAQAPAGEAGPVQETRDEQFGGNETVLLCEDEDPVRTLIEGILIGEGYRVLSSSAPHTALELAAGHRDDIDLLVTDVILPGLSGPDLAARLRVEMPELRTLFLSGYTLNTLRDRGRLPAGSAFLGKPFDRTSLLRQVRELLDRSARTGHCVNPPRDTSA